MRGDAYSVIIPAMNAEPFIEQAVTSAFAQIPAPSEVIVVNDGSVDDTARVAARGGARVLYSGGPIGPGSARNLGVSASETPLIAFLDADDAWTAGHVSSCLALLQDEAIAVAFSATQMFGRVNSLITPDVPVGVPFDARKALLARNVVPQSGVLLRAAAFRQAGGYNSLFPVAEDYELWMRLAASASFGYTALPTSLRRIHEQQLTLKRRNEMIVLSWRVRTDAVARWQADDPSSVEWVVPQLVVAAREDMQSVVWTGDANDLSGLFSVLDSVVIGDPPQLLLEATEVRLGRGSWRRRILDAQCRGRAFASRLLQRRHQ